MKEGAARQAGIDETLVTVSPDAHEGVKELPRALYERWAGASHQSSGDERRCGQVVEGAPKPQEAEQHQSEGGDPQRAIVVPKEVGGGPRHGRPLGPARARGSGLTCESLVAQGLLGTLQGGTKRHAPGPGHALAAVALDALPHPPAFAGRIDAHGAGTLAAGAASKIMGIAMAI